MTASPWGTKKSAAARIQSVIEPTPAAGRRRRPRNAEHGDEIEQDQVA